SLQVVNTIDLPSEAPGDVYSFLWSPSSRKFLLAGPDQIRVFSALDGAFRASIRNPQAVSPMGKGTFVSFGPSDAEVCVCSALGLKFVVFNLATSTAVEMPGPKFYSPVSAPRSFSFRPQTSHLALLTRASARDVVSIHHPVTHELQRSW